MATASMTTVLNKMTDIVGDEWKLLMKVVKDVKSLGDKFEWLQAQLIEADQKRRVNTNSFVAVWVKQTRDTAFEVEDILDEFSWKVEKAKLSLYDWKAILQFQWATTGFTQLWVTHELSSKIDYIRMRMKDLETYKDTYNIVLTPSSLSWTPSFNNNFTSWSDQDSGAPVGLESKVQELIDLLTKDEKKREVISLNGKNGSGRSMLAKRACGSSEIQKHFEVVISKSLPPRFRVDEALSDIHRKLLKQEGKGHNDYEQICPICLLGCPRDREQTDTQEDKGNKDQTSIRDTLRHRLKGRRYLIVLIGIDSWEDWMTMQSSFPNNDKGSKIVLIARNGSEVIARFPKKEGITTFEPRLPFGQEESQELFLQRFPKKLSYPIECGKYLRQIHEVTKGHPMTIVLLAYLLGSKQVSDWEKVFEYLKASKEPYPIYRMLALSFDDLPNQLKSCFLYFAAVPQSTGIKVNHLVRLWVAEGFIQPTPGKTLEEVGEGYLKELISRLLVRIEEKNEFGVVTVVAVDDHIYSFLQSEAHETSFVEIHDNANLVSPAKIRRLAIQNYSHGYVEIKNSLPKLRTLLCDCSEKQIPIPKQQGLKFLLKSKFLSCDYSEKQIPISKQHGLKFLLKSKFLRVIDLHGLNVEKLPNGFTAMIHLRYLGIRCEAFCMLPSSIGKLRNLQTLDVCESSVENMPDSLWRISALRHVLSDSVKLPKKFGELRNLQTLHVVDCTDWEPKKCKLLDNISNIRKLKLKELSTDVVEEICESLKRLVFLRHLSLTVKEKEGNLESIPFKLFNIESLRCLRSMELYGQLQNLPELDTSRIQYNLPNLISLTITNSTINQQFIGHLSKLPSLTRLSLCKSYKEESIAFPPDGFESLKVLEVSGSKELKEWKEITVGALPNLKRLILSGCTQLQSLPEGLQNLKLEEVVLYGIKKFTDQIRAKEGDDYKKIEKVNAIKPKPPINDARTAYWSRHLFFNL